MDLPHATEVPDTDWINEVYGQCVFFLSLSVWPMCFSVFFLVLISVGSTICNARGNRVPAALHWRPFWHIFGWHSPHVCLCFSFHDCPMHIMQPLVGKVSNQRLKWYTTHCWLVLLKGSYKGPKSSFLTFCEVFTSHTLQVLLKCVSSLKLQNITITLNTVCTFILFNCSTVFALNCICTTVNRFMLYVRELKKVNSAYSI